MARVLFSLLPAVLFATTVAAAPPGPDETWPGFRGHELSGVAPGGSVPERWSVDRARALEAGRAGARLVVADRVGRHRVPDLRDQQQAVQAADARSLRQRLHRRDAGAGTARRGDQAPGPGARQRDREEADEIRYMVYAARRRDRQDQVGAGGAQADCRSAAAIARTPTRRRRRSPTASGSMPRSARTSACSAIRSTARCSGRSSGRRSRSISTSAPRRRRSCTTAASTCCRTAKPSRPSPRSTPRPARSCGARRPNTGLPRSSWMTPFVWKHAPRTEIVTTGHGLGHLLRPGRQGAVAGHGMSMPTASPFAAEWPALCRHRLAGRREPAVPGHQAGRERRHLAEGHARQQRVHRVASSARVRLHAVGIVHATAPISSTTPAS